MGTYRPITEKSGDRKRNWLVRGWLAVGLAVSALLFVRAMPHSPLRGSTQRARPAAVPVVPATSAQGTTATSAQGATASVGVPTTRTETIYVRRLITQPIETIRVGQRVLGTNPNRDEVEEFEEPDPKTWRTIEVEQIKPSGKKLYATLLRPLDWIEEELDPETNTIELDLPELGAEGEARVLRIGPCPAIAAGNGHIVTATFKHEPDGELLTVTVGNDEIGCTANHPFWSEDRQEFVEAGQLRQGERVRTRLEEVAAVVAVKPRPPTAWVYNLEVQGEHVYEVGPGGVLVHNTCSIHWPDVLYRIHRRVVNSLDHVWIRHRWGSHYEGVSRFSSVFRTKFQVKALVAKAVNKGRIVSETRLENGTRELIIEMDRVIGLSQQGIPTKQLKVYLSANNGVLTAFPW